MLLEKQEMKISKLFVCVLNSFIFIYLFLSVRAVGSFRLVYNDSGLSCAQIKSTSLSPEHKCK